MRNLITRTRYDGTRSPRVLGIRGGECEAYRTRPVADGLEKRKPTMPSVLKDTLRRSSNAFDAPNAPAGPRGTMGSGRTGTAVVPGTGRLHARSRKGNCQERHDGSVWVGVEKGGGPSPWVATCVQPHTDMESGEVGRKVETLFHRCNCNATHLPNRVPLLSALVSDLGQSREDKDGLVCLAPRVCDSG